MDISFCYYWFSLLYTWYVPFFCKAASRNMQDNGHPLIWLGIPSCPLKITWTQKPKKQKAVVIGLHGLKLVQNIFCFLQNLLWFQASFFKDSNNKQNHNTLVNIRVQRNSPSWYNAFAEIRSSSLFWPSMSWLDSVSAILFFYCWVTLVGTCHINPLLGQ